MAHPTRSSFHLLLTTALCGFLAACGGDRVASQGAYRGENGEARTAVLSASQAKQTTPLAARVAKLESDVAGMRNDMSQLAMTYNGLMTTNERIDSLLTKLESAPPAAAAQPPVERADLMPPAKVEKKEAPKREKAAETKPLPVGPTVLGVRLGEHADKTRMVIDWSKLGTVKTDLDNNEKLLIITLSDTAWDAKRAVSGLSSPLISGWTLQEDQGAKTLVVQLKKPVKILNVGKLKPENGASARVVIDLAAS